MSEDKKARILNVINESYIDLDKEVQIYIGYYFRFLFYMIKFIDEKEFLIEKEKFFYINLIRANKSGYELLLLFYNCLSDRGNKYFKPLVERYSFLHNNNEIEAELTDKSNTDHKVLYNPIAFK